MLKGYIYTITPQLEYSKEIKIYGRNSKDAEMLKDLFETKQHIKLEIKEIKTTRKNSNEYKSLLQKFNTEENVITAQIEAVKNMKELTK